LHSRFKMSLVANYDKLIELFKTMPDDAGSTEQLPSPSTHVKKTPEKQKLSKKERKKMQAKSKKMGESGKKKILLLHGYMQSTKSFQSRNKKKLFKYFNKSFDCVFWEGPHQATFKLANDEQKTYFQVSERVLDVLMNPEERHKILTPEYKTAEYKLLDATLEELSSFWKAEGPFHAIFCFSMSSLLVHTLAWLRDEGVAPFNTLEAVVICSGSAQPFPSNHDFGKLGSGNCLQVPSLHCYSLNDKYVPADESLAGSLLYKDSETLVVNHKAHALPGKANERKAIVQFLESCLLK